MTRVIVCGGRDFNDRNRAFTELDALNRELCISHVIEGGARGADRLGRLWAYERGIPYTTVEAEWNRYGKSAGFIRNKRMRDEYSPDAVIAMPGGVGTAMMIKLAKEKDIPVFEINL